MLFFLKLSFLLVSGCCAPLPNVHHMIANFTQYGDAGNVPGTVRDHTPEGFSAFMAGLQRQPSRMSRLTRQVALMQAVGGSPLMSGNRVTILSDGAATFDAMLRAISQAKDHVNFETYIINDDETGRLFADMFLKKQAQGVQVNVIYDGFGCRRTPASFFKRLRVGGVHAVEFNPMGPFKGREGDIFHRTHRKILIVDGVIAFTGGINIGNEYSYRPVTGNDGAEDGNFWRDTHVMIEGPGALEFQRLFLITWARQNGPQLVRGTYFPSVPDRGDQAVQVVGSTSGYMERVTYMMYVSAIAHATSTVHMVQSYFIPDRQMMQALIDAAKRGVDVKIILPRNTDHRIIRYAGRSCYKELLGAGVRLYERAEAILHAKTAVIDGVWSTIGTTNFELWSFASNDEVNAVILGTQCADEMEASFARDLARSVEITEEEWARRPGLERSKEFLARLFKYWL